MSSVLKAEAANQDMDKLLRLGTTAITTSFIEKAILSGQDLGEAYQTALLKPLSTTMALSYLMGKRRAMMDVGASWLSLDRYSEIRKLLRELGLEKELTAEQKRAARAIYSDLYKLGANVEAKIRFAISQVVATTKDNRRGLQEVRRILRSLGITQNIKTIFNTAIARSYGKGKWDTFANLDIWGFEYVTMRDDRVRPAHRTLDRTVLPKEDEFWQIYWPPNGWNCRCVVVGLKTKQKIKRPRNPAPPDEGFEKKLNLTL